MEMVTIVTILLGVLYFIEAKHDLVLEKMWISKDQTEFVKSWHKIDFIFHILVGVIISFSLFGISIDSILFLVNIGFIRQLVLNSSLNILKGRQIYYLGTTSKIDKLLKPIQITYFCFLVLINFIFILYFSGPLKAII